MNLAAMLAAHDEAALEALSNKGILRRASRDLAAGLAQIVERSAEAAVVHADDQTVTLRASGLRDATCGCSAGGVCRHMTLAVLALRAVGAAEPAPAAAPSALDRVCALEEEGLQRFAGADWPKALELAASATVSASSSPCIVSFDDGAATVSFIEGLLTLKDAAYKGPKTKRRLFVTAAALAARAGRGLVPASVAKTARLHASLSPAFLNHVDRNLERCVRITLATASPLAADALLDLGVSARADAAPRLAAELRALAQQANLAARRHVGFDPEAFLLSAGRLAALVCALREAPEDPLLSGVLRRTYEPAPALSLWVLGASRWRSAAGARGLSLHGYAPELQSWRTLTLARGPGLDPSFSPEQAFRQERIWGLCTPAALIGAKVRLDRPKATADGSISPTLPDPALRMGDVGPEDLETLAVSDWSALQADVAARLGSGLRRRAAPVAALIAPDAYGEPTFDELAQMWRCGVADASGDRLELASRDRTGLAPAPFLLIEAREEAQGVRFRPIAACYGAPLCALNFDFDPPPAQPAPSERPLPPADPDLRRHDPFAIAISAARSAIEAAVQVAGGSPLAAAAPAARACEAAGLYTLAAAMERLAKSGCVQDALQAAYIASETLAAARRR